jgi:hypothetical protein
VVESGFWPWDGGHASGHGAEKAQDTLQDNARGPLLATETRDATIVPRELRLFYPTGGKKRGGGVYNQHRPHQPAVLRSMSRATVSSARASMSGRASVAASMSAMVVSSCDTRRSISSRCCRTVSTRLAFSD